MVVQENWGRKVCIINSATYIFSCGNNLATASCRGNTASTRRHEYKDIASSGSAGNAGQH
jgi:hypothetical protein